MNKFSIAESLKIPEWSDYQVRLNSILLTCLSDAPKPIKQSLTRMLSPKAKRLRPAILIAVVMACGQEIDEKVLTLAASIELLHIASLIHDDIIDNADSRWSVATINAREGVDYAILAGDYLFAKSIEMASAISSDCGLVLALAFSEMTVGQIFEMADSYNTKRSVDSMFKAIDGKTSALMSATCRIGGLCAGLSKDKLSRLAEFGINFGRSFQLVDDLLDLIGDAKLIGKLSGNDVKEGVYTLPILLSLKSEDSNVSKYLNDRFDLTLLPELLDVITLDGSITETYRRIAKINTQASDILKSDKNDNFHALARVPSIYAEWALKNLALKKYQKLFN